MSETNFEELIKSVRETGAAMRGESEPSRAFEAHAATGDQPLERFAVCIKTDDERLLVPRKIYDAMVFQDCVRVIDEAGEAAIYPQDYFLLIDLPPQSARALQQAVHQQLGHKRGS